MIPASVLLATSTVLIGWVALLPLRDRIGVLGYHLAALPVGVLGWSFVGAVSMALRTGWTPFLVIGSLLVWCGFVWVAARLLTGSFDVRVLLTSGTWWWTYLLWLVVVAGFAFYFARLGVSTFSADGWSQYEPDGIILNEIGRTSPRALGNRMVTVSAIHAAYHFFGGEFTHGIQPVLGLVTALLVGAGVWWATAGRMGTVPRAAVSLAPMLVLPTNAVYAFHSVYLHSHMTTAMFLILAIVALMRATEGGGHDRGAVEPAWLVLAGLGTAGIVLARPDGAAYAVVPILVAAALLVRLRTSGRSADAYFGPLLGASGLVIAGGVIQHGMWWTRKLSLQTLLLFLAVYAVAWVLVRTLSSGDRVGWFKSGTNSLRLAVAYDMLVLIAVWRFWSETVMRSLENMVSNLLSTGGYRTFWPFAAGMIGISLSLRPKSTRHLFTAYALFAVVQFMIIAFVLHGIRHPGRIGWGDSFTRVSFQIVPVIYLYVGLYLGELAEALRPRTR